MKSVRNILNRARAKKILSDLKVHEGVPQVEFALVGPFVMCTAFERSGSAGDGVDVNSTCGMSRSADEALAKALVEWVERRAVRATFSTDATRQHSSDGFAAYPSFLSLRYQTHARNNSYSEALERYAWIQWWHNHSIGFDLVDVTLEAMKRMDCNSFLHPDYKIEKVQLLRPHLESNDTSLVILICKLEKFGYITGGACGSDSTSTFDRAIGELMRHYLGFKQLASGGFKAADNYNRRLLHFGQGLGNAKVNNRLAATGKKKIKAPSLLIDQEVSHDLQSSVYVHRCLFKGQPEFLNDDESVFAL